MGTQELRHMPKALETIRALSSEHDLNDQASIGSNFEKLVVSLRETIADHTIVAIGRLNGASSSVYDPSDAAFGDAVGMVAEDVANALLRQRQGDAFELLDRSALDVLAQIAHLRLDFQGQQSIAE